MEKNLKKYHTWAKRYFMFVKEGSVLLYFPSRFKPENLSDIKGFYLKWIDKIKIDEKKNTIEIVLLNNQY